jgi:hypothetical protein
MAAGSKSSLRSDSKRRHEILAAAGGLGPADLLVVTGLIVVGFRGSYAA